MSDIIWKRIGVPKPPTEIELARERYGYTPGEAERCDCCGAKAKTKVDFSPPMHAVTDVSIRDGWARFIFPWKEQSYGARWEEKWLCENCARKVAEYIGHMSKPWTGDEDIL